MNRAVGSLAVVFALAVVAVPVASQPADPTVAASLTRTAAVAEAVRLSRRPLLHVGTGLVVGLGIGAVAGSVATFQYWTKKLS